MGDAPRRHDLDWLRIGATALLFPFHVAKTFDVLPIYHIKNAELSSGLGYFTFFIHQWHMPLFFVLAGWSACAAIQRRGVAGFRRERVRRLLVPFFAAKFALLLLITVVSTMVVYQVAVRPTPLLRALLGMRERRSNVPATAGALPA